MDRAERQRQSRRRRTRPTARYAMHLSNLHSHPQLFLHVAQMPGIKDVLWGRYYLYMDPGAPRSRRAGQEAFDMQTNWYEVGFEQCVPRQLACSPGRRSREVHAQQIRHPQEDWACVEFTFDGATPNMAKVWSDGTPVMFDDIAKTPTIMKTVQFTTFDIGIVFYHGTSLTD